MSTFDFKSLYFTRIGRNFGDFAIFTSLKATFTNHYTTVIFIFFSLRLYKLNLLEIEKEMIGLPIFGDLIS